MNWNSFFNYIPLAKLYDGDVGTANTNVIVGSTQDNVNPITTNGGLSWKFPSTAGDGFSAVVNPENSNNFIYQSNTILTRTTDGGITLLPGGTGVTGITRPGNFSSDRYSPINMYYFTSGFLYKSITGGSSWQKLNTLPLSTLFSQIGVEKGSQGNTREVIYLPNKFGFALTVYENGALLDRASGLPGGNKFRVTTHPRNIETAFAIIPGTSGIPQIFKTKNTGVNWYSISGNFPPVPVTDVAVSPVDSNILVASSMGFGFYRSNNAGQNWFRLNNGTPKATWCDKMSFIDSASINKFYIVAFTNGRGVMVRNINDPDSIQIGIPNISSKLNYELMQNYPNPFNPVTNIKYSIKAAGVVRLRLYYVSGKLIEDLVNEYKAAGSYSVVVSGLNLSSGIYFYKIEAGSFSTVKKMLLVK